MNSAGFQLLVCATIVVGLALAVEDSVLFDRNAPEFEDVLNADDFARAAYVTSDGVKEVKPRHIRKDLFEGDISNRQLKNAASVERFVNQVGQPPQTNSSDVMHNALRNRYELWPEGVIPYTLSSRYSAYSRSRIAAAMKVYSRLTCIKFVPRKSGQRNYVYILPDDGCYSEVGMSGGRQTLSLGSGCVDKATVIHELMHVVGFFHEQSRADRDTYVRINWQNIPRDLHDQFEKYSLRTIQYLGEPYDYASIMHYGPSEFSRNGRPTITPLRDTGGARIGAASTFSSIDTAKINKLYRCDGQAGITLQPATVRPTFRPPVRPTAPPTGGGRGRPCRDLGHDCRRLSGQKWCQTHQNLMRLLCRATCGMC